MTICSSKGYNSIRLLFICIEDRSHRHEDYQEWYRLYLPRFKNTCFGYLEHVPDHGQDSLQEEVLEFLLSLLALVSLWASVKKRDYSSPRERRAAWQGLAREKILKTNPLFWCQQMLLISSQFIVILLELTWLSSTKWYSWSLYVNILCQIFYYQLSNKQDDVATTKTDSSNCG